MADREWSDQQRAIFDFFEKGTGNLVVRARAGTGKTTTIMEALKYAKERDILLAAFNKLIALELQAKLENPLAKAKTLHSVGCAFVYRNWDGVQLDQERGERLARRVLGPRCPDPAVNLTVRLASLGKGAAPFPTPGELVDLAYAHDLDPDDYLQDDGWTVERLADAAEKSMELACEKDGTMDFDDMVFVPIRNGWIRPKFDLVVIDEAQDMNVSQLILAKSSCKKNGRVIVVGDDRQAIYAFRGADSNSIDRLKGELIAHELGLTITYRCPRKVVDIARRLVPDYSSAPNAPDGVVRSAVYEKMVEEAGPGDFVLSRKNAPLAKVCLRFIRMGKRAMIEGREIGSGLITVMNKIRGKSVPDFLEKLGKWETKQVERLRKTGKKAAEKKIEYVQDQSETLRALAETAKSVSDVEARIREMFQESDDPKNDKLDRIVCSSVHKAKGRERDRVWGLVETLYPGGQTGSIEEQNIHYVMLTRAKKEFVSVTGIG